MSFLAQLHPCSQSTKKGNYSVLERFHTSTAKKTGIVQGNSNLEFILDMLFGLNTGYSPKVHHQNMQMQRADNFAALPVRGD